MVYKSKRNSGADEGCYCNQNGECLLKRGMYSDDNKKRCEMEKPDKKSCEFYGAVTGRLESRIKQVL